MLHYYYVLSFVTINYTKFIEEILPYIDNYVIDETKPLSEEIEDIALDTLKVMYKTREEYSKRRILEANRYQEYATVFQSKDQKFTVLVKEYGNVELRKGIENTIPSIGYAIKIYINDKELFYEFLDSFLFSYQNSDFNISLDTWKTIEKKEIKEENNDKHDLPKPPNLEFDMQKSAVGAAAIRREL